MRAGNATAAAAAHSQATTGSHDAPLARSLTAS